MHHFSEKSLLDRTAPAADFAKHFEPLAAVLGNVVDYGVQLVPNAFSRSCRQMGDIIAVGVLLPQVVLMADAVHILLPQGAVEAACAQARGALEASWYVHWILKEKSEERAKYYYVSCLRQQRQFALRVVKGTPERERFAATADFLGLDDKGLQQELARESSAEVSRIDAVLSKDVFTNINKKFEERRTKKGRNRKGKLKGGKKAEPKWFEPLDIDSIRKIAADVGRLPEYDMYYSHFSAVVHASSYRNRVRVDAGIAVL